jgi:hypothetical protein
MRIGRNGPLRSHRPCAHCRVQRIQGRKTLRPKRMTHRQRDWMSSRAACLRRRLDCQHGEGRPSLCDTYTWIKIVLQKSKISVSAVKLILRRYICADRVRIDALVLISGAPEPFRGQIQWTIEETQSQAVRSRLQLVVLLIPVVPAREASAADSEY